MNKDKNCCIGCDDNFYNGNNPLGIKECWNFKGAEMITVFSIGWWTPCDNAKNFTKTKKLSCYSQRGRTAYFRELPEHLR